MEVGFLVAQAFDAAFGFGGATSAVDRLAAVPFPTNGDPGFLDGAAGVVLAVLGAATDVEPEWDRALLLA
ncbi:hypothetical protein [Streptomyces roseoverticillatus]|uniref:Uncharacterized protein n=1 Tax=Streptomyces roseoverticillatus TaxID=66429 RepID=A0ABV3J333_9ACTN